VERGAKDVLRVRVGVPHFRVDRVVDSVMFVNCVVWLPLGSLRSGLVGGATASFKHAWCRTLPARLAARDGRQSSTVSSTSSQTLQSGIPRPHTIPHEDTCYIRLFGKHPKVCSS